MSFQIHPLALLIPLLLLSSTYLFESCLAFTEGFSVELIHRDSSKSPSCNREETVTQRLLNAIRRSSFRANRLASTDVIRENGPSSDVIGDNGEYLMNISIGTPPRPILAYLDIGSSLVWTQCEPCTNCFKQITPPFDPKKSSTYHDISCTSSECHLFLETQCAAQGNTCQYSYEYGQDFSTTGTIASDTVTMFSASTQPISFPNILFGCGHDNRGSSLTNRTTGIVGLGNGPSSLLSQIGSASGGLFSYCLVSPFVEERDKTSKLNFGSNAVVSGPGVMSSPLITRNDSFYYLTLEAISVDDSRVDVSPYPKIPPPEGNIFIDTASTATYLPGEMFDRLSDKVAQSVPFERVDGGPYNMGLCFRTKTDIVSPTITVHFKGGADLKLSPGSSYARVDDDVVCFTFTESSATLPWYIFGNLAQTGFLVGYNLNQKTVSFKPNVDCSKS